MSELDKQNGGQSLDDLLADVVPEKSKVDEPTILETKSKEYGAKLKAKAAELKEKSKDYKEKVQKDAVDIIDHTGDVRGKGIAFAGKAVSGVGNFKAKTGLSLLPIVIGLCIAGGSIYKTVGLTPPSIGALNNEAWRAQNLNGDDWGVNRSRTSNEWEYKKEGLPELDTSNVEKDVANIRFKSCHRGASETWVCKLTYDSAAGPQAQTMTFRDKDGVALRCIDCTRAWYVTGKAQAIGRDAEGVVFAMTKVGGQ